MHPLEVKSSLLMVSIGISSVAKTLVADRRRPMAYGMIRRAVRCHHEVLGGVCDLSRFDILLHVSVRTLGVLRMLPLGSCFRSLFCLFFAGLLSLNLRILSNERGSKFLFASDCLSFFPRPSLCRLAQTGLHA